ncbi:MAG: hydrogenase expression/formation protein HypE [Planctomycetota bacterium]|jgi:hydrogenase expression/formation protein HypE
MNLNYTATASQSDTGGMQPLGSCRVVLAHGGGGQLTDELITDSIVPRLGNDLLNQLLDSALLPLPHAPQTGRTAGSRLAFTIDSYVVSPWRFPGADIGRLAVSGTVNDLAVAGARPIGVALGLIITEGFARRDLDTVLDSIAATATEAGVSVVTGDTKVVGHDQGDGIYITTSGVGIVPAERRLHPERVRPGDLLLINGPIGDHGLAVMLEREMPEVDSVLRSDAAPLNRLIEAVLGEAGDGVVFMRDPTRSGVAALASDLSRDTGLRVTLDEQAIPIRPEARHAADMLGLDPLEIANEGKAVIVARPDAADRVLNALRHHPLGTHAAVIGRVEDSRDGICELRTVIGGRRIIQKPYGEQLPRIC